MTDEGRRDVAELFQLLRQYPLDQITEAIGYQETGHARGKVVVTMQ